MTDLPGIALVIPAWNEADSIASVVRQCRESLSLIGIAHVVIVVDDGSSDATGAHARDAGALVLRNPINRGYGYSILRGVQESPHELIGILDADGTYNPEALAELIEACRDFDMVVGQRTGKHYHSHPIKNLSRRVFRLLAEYTAGSRIPDINSGLRIFRRTFVMQHRRSLSTGFSFTTTITLIALLESHNVGFIPISYSARVGKSKVRWIRDTLRSLQIITEVILIYNPLKFFLLLTVIPIALFVVTAVLQASLPHEGTAIALMLSWRQFVAAAHVVTVIAALGAASFTIVGTARRLVLHEPSRTEPGDAVSQHTRMP